MWVEFDETIHVTEVNKNDESELAALAKGSVIFINETRKTYKHKKKVQGLK